MRPSFLQRVLFRARLQRARHAGRDLTLEGRYLERPLRLSLSTPRELQRALEFHEETDLLEAMVDRTRSGDVVYDVGANIGLVGLVVALHRDVRVLGFEPEPANLARFQANVAANALEGRVDAHGLALGADTGSIPLHVRGGAGEGRHSTVDDRKAERAIQVPVETAAAFASRTGTPPDVAKVDVEGAEGAVLAGMEPLMREGRPRELFLEVHPKGQGDRMPDGSPIHDWLTSRGYERVWTAPRGSREYRHYARDPRTPGAP